LAKPLIILDAGHNEKVGGKRSPDGTLKEWEFNNDMQIRIKKRLLELGFDVYLTNPSPAGKDEIGLAKRAQLANSYWTSKGKPNAVFVSLHANAAGSSGWSTARGVEVYASKSCSVASKNAAKKINDAIFKDVYAFDKGFKNRGFKQNNFYVVAHTNMPACLIEYEFYSNKEGVKLLKNKRDVLCEATLKGICSHFNVPYKQGSAAAPANPVTGVPSTCKPWKNGTYNVNAKVLASSLNVRQGRPGSDKYNNILGTLPRNTVVKVGYCLNGWFGITYDGKQGFISGDYIQLV
jgi:N-acetylmuramoyl-L-alanine amidase